MRVYAIKVSTHRATRLCLNTVDCNVSPATRRETKRMNDILNDALSHHAHVHAYEESRTVEKPAKLLRKSGVLLVIS